MIHSMWATFYAAALQGCWSSSGTTFGDETPDQARKRMAKVSAEMADHMCAEYDKRNQPETGSPYRG